MISEKSKKTNSLAFARTDCHTCTATAQVCDRRRPQCTTCLADGRQCGGFATPLSWNTSRMWLGRPASKSDSAVVQQIPDGDGDNLAGDDSADRDTSSRHFRFVTGKIRSRKRRRIDAQRSPITQVVASPTSPVLPHREAEAPGFQIDDQATGLTPFLIDDFDLFNAHDCLADMLQSGMPGLDLTTMEGNPVPGGAPEAVEAPSIQNLDEAIDTSFPYTISSLLPADASSAAALRNAGPETQPAIAGDQHQALLRLYDTEFCVLPLTSDTALNPFRCSQQTSRGSRLLFHAILAICCQHLNRLTGSWATEAEEHRIQAAKLLNDALQQEQVSRLGLALLDPILVIFTLDCTISAIGPWTEHLHRVRSILQVCGGPTALDTPRTRSQVAMLVWWDATLALVSRQGTILSKAFLDHLVRCERADQWSFYDLAGCPGDLVVHLFQLAELAKQNEIAASMAWLTFDQTPVRQIERQLRQWKTPAFASPCLADSPDPDEVDDETGDEGEEGMHAQQDRFHCAEAWRYALLIYIERVLKWDRKARPPCKALTRLVRTMLDHVRCCRRTSQTQKQLLLPMFLAGSETKDEDMRDFVITYCQWWGNRSRYSMFDSVPALLREVWAESSSDRQWWGVVVDRKTKAEQFLLG
ncbi:fungal-specific transcription factor domain-containing protein [Aspergillus californicus]